MRLNYDKVTTGRKGMPPPPRITYAEAVAAIRALPPGWPGSALRDELRILESHLPVLSIRRSPCWLRRQRCRLIAAYLHTTTQPPEIPNFLS